MRGRRGRLIRAPTTARAQAALDLSLPIKRSEAGLKSLVLWGRLLARNGKVCVLAAVFRPAVLHGRPAPPTHAACTACYLRACMQDYLIAEGCNTATVKGKAVSWEAKYYFSQDGVR